MAETTPKRVRAKRRDWRKEMEALTAHCQTAIELMTEVRDKCGHDKCGEAAIGSPYWDGQVTALKSVLARIERKP